MKTIKFLLVIILIITLVNLPIEPKIKLKSDSPIAVMMKIIKEVKLKKLNENWKDVKTGTPLITGDEVKTGSKSFALIKFTDNSLLRLRENTLIKIYADKKGKNISKNTYLENGKLGFKVMKQEDEEFQLTTPTMVASIRGTEGFLQINDDGSSLLIVETGSIDINALLGNKNSGNIKDGQYALVGSDGEVIIGNITDEQKEEGNSIRKTNSKKIIIKTNSGDLIIEYLSED
ncbi:MAG: hypothetical protein STSR0008_11120 [Ignavibacterium sp.]